ncbi:MAG TPA: SCO family protein [Steroidobacteraceae bacterium]|nr:SCO family protein [Steroidobacteraceae bacterium]
MSTARMRWLLILAAACAALSGFWFARQLDRESPRLASGTWLPQPKAVGAFTLMDSAGHPYTRAELLAAPTLVYFGFTRCPDVCPTTLVKLAQVLRQAPVPRLRVLFVSVDPQRDTPPVLALYVHAFDPAITGVTGAPAQILAVAKNFAVAVNRVELPGGDYTMDHSAVVFLVDGRGIETIFTPPFDARTLTEDLRRAAPLLAPAAAGGGA